MADLSQTIKIVFEGVDNTATALSSINQGIGDLADNLENATQPFADLTKGILAFDAVVVGLAATLAGAAIKETAQFEESMYLVAKQMGDTDKSLEDVRDEIETVGLAYGVNANEVAKATATFLASGKDYETSAKLVEASTQLMIAGELEASVATEAISASLAGFKVPADEFVTAGFKIGDILNKIGDISSGAFDQIVDGFKTIAPTAKDAGLSMEQAAAAIATIVDTGYSGSEAANALKSGLVQLVDPPKDARDALAALGVELTNSNGTQKLAGDIMADLAGKYGGLTEEQKLQTAAVIFGKDQAGKLNALLGDWGKSQDYVAQMTDKTTGAVGSMAREVEGKLGTLQSAIDKSNEAWRQFLENLGKRINAQDDVEDFYKSLQRLGEVLKTVLKSGDLDPLIKPFQDAYDTIGKLFDDLAANLPAALDKIDWSKFEGAIGDLADSFGDMFGDIDLTTPEGLAEVIQTLIDLGAGLIETSSGIIEGLKPLFEIIGGLVTGFANLDPEVQKSIGVFLGLSTTVNVLSGYAKTFSDVIAGGGGLISSLSKLGPVALAAGVAFAAFKLGQFASEATGAGAAADKLVEKMNGVEDAAKQADRPLQDTNTTLNTLGNTTDQAGKRLKEFNAAVASGELIFDKTANAWVKASEAAEKVVVAEIGILGVTTDLEPAMLDLYSALGLTADGTKKLADATKDGVLSQSDYKAGLAALDAAFKDGSLSLDQYTIAVEQINISAGKAPPALDKMTKAEEDAAKKTKDLAAESEKFALEWGKLLSAERIAVFEASADIQVAQIEADSKRAVAAMEMLGASFANTGDVLTELIGLWVGLEGMDQSTIEGWIEREYEIRAALAQAQIDMVNAEIRRLEAQTALLERGGVELKITADGMEEDLKQFMFQIIDRVRVSVAGSYEEFLLGCGA